MHNWIPLTVASLGTLRGRRFVSAGRVAVVIAIWKSLIIVWESHIIVGKSIEVRGKLRLAFPGGDGHWRWGVRGRVVVQCWAGLERHPPTHTCQGQAYYQQLLLHFRLGTMSD